MLKLNHLTGFGSGAAGGDNTSYAFDGTGTRYLTDGTYLSVPSSSDWAVGTGQFTFELWVYVTQAVDNQVMMHNLTDATVSTNWNFMLGASQVPTFNSGVAAIKGGSTSVSLNTWTHILVSRDGSNDVRMFIDGVEEGAAANSANDFSSDDFMQIARVAWSGGASFKGYLDEIRISDIARHTTAFTPETTQCTSDANTLLLIHGGETKSGTTGSGATFTESGNTGHTVTEVGNAEATGNFYKF